MPLNNSKKLKDADSSVQFAKVEVLSQIIDYHVEEEENIAFQAAKSVLTKEDEKEIRLQFQEEKIQHKMTPTLKNHLLKVGCLSIFTKPVSLHFSFR
jgi:hemerythrin-like domain-containing protein